jgi:putative tricarboxylic transport membrane protein
MRANVRKVLELRRRSDANKLEGGERMSRSFFGQAVVVGCSALLLLSVACAGPSAPAPAQQAAKFPAKPIIFVVTSTVGGGADVQARLAADAIEKSSIINETVAVVNKGSAGTKEGFTFVAGKKGDPHYLLGATTGFQTAPMTGDAGYELKDFTPIANLVMDPSIIVTRAESPYKTFADVINAAKASPGTITIGGSAMGNPTHLSVKSVEQAAGVKFKWVSFAGGADVHRAALGGQTDLGAGNPSDFMASLEGGKLRALAIADEARNTAPILKDVPTTKELGFPYTSPPQWRGWFAPAGINKDVIPIMEQMFKKVVEDKGFQDNYVARYGMRAAFMGSAEFSKLLDDSMPVYEKNLSELGILKQGYKR